MHFWPPESLLIDTTLADVGEDLPTNQTPKMAGGLRLIAHDESEFHEHVSSIYPKIANHELYPKAKKFMAVLHHDGHRQVKAYRVIWTIQQSPNRTRAMQAIHIRQHAMLKSAVKVVKPGTKRLVSPFFNFSTVDHNFNPDSADLRALTHSHFPFLDSDLISVEFDAVIYSDNTVAGADKYDLASHYTAARAAEHNEGVSLFRKLKQMKSALGPGETLTLSKVASTLDFDVQYGQSHPGTDPDATKRIVRSQEAAIMKGILTSRGIATLRSNVVRRLGYPKDTLTRIG